MNTRRLVVWITFLAIFAMAARISVDTDTWWHLRAGQWMAQNRAILQVDLFSYTRYGQAWQYPGWLVEVPMYWIYSAFGAGGLNIWTALMVTLSFGFIWRTMPGGVFLRAFVIILAVTVSGVYWAARPYLVTFLLAAVYLLILENFRWRRDKNDVRNLWWLPALMVIWANSHGGFAAGFLIWGVYLAGELVQWIRSWLAQRFLSASGPIAGNRRDILQLSLIGLAMLVAVCLNPSGPVMLLYPFKTIGIGSLQSFIQEWQSPNFHELNVQPFAWLLFTLLGVVGASRRRLALTDFLLIAGFAYMGLMAARNIALFALVAPPVVARHADALIQNLAGVMPLKSSPDAPPKRGQAILNYSLLGLLSLAVLVKLTLIFPQEPNQEHFEETLPVQAIAAIRSEQPPGRLFNSYNYGGYLVWALPEYPVFIDGRTDLYDDEIIDQWLKVMRAEDGWQDVINRWDVHLVMVEPDTPIVERLVQQGWKELYRDEIVDVLAE